MSARLVLLLAAFGLVPVALSYGVMPGESAPLLMGFDVEGTQLTHVMRGLMGLYLANAAFWLAGALRPSLRRPALLGLLVFMGGVALGRALSLVADGWPGFSLFAYLVIEVIFVVLAWRALKETEA